MYPIGCTKRRHYFDTTYSKILGPNCCINSSRIDVFLQNEPQPTATKNLIHLSQSKSINWQHFCCN